MKTTTRFHAREERVYDLSMGRSAQFASHDSALDSAYRFAVGLSNLKDYCWDRTNLQFLRFLNSKVNP